MLSRTLRYRISWPLVRCAAAICRVFSSGHGRQPALRAIRAEISGLPSRAPLTRDECSRAWRIASGLQRELTRRADRYLVSGHDRAEAAYLAFRDLMPGMMRAIGELSRDADSRIRLERAGRIASRGILYLCSSHAGCAEGHLEYQGKLYVSSHWRERCRDAKLRKRLAKMIRDRHIRTVEWAMGAPAYLLTRPNCRHRMVRVPIEEALGSTVRKMLRRRDLIRTDPEEPAWAGEIRRRRAQLRILRFLQGALPCSALDEDVRKLSRSIRKTAARHKPDDRVPNPAA